jgi:mRNA interferase RelE/StbE
MAFEVRWDKKAVHFLRKQDISISNRIVNKVDLIKENPAQHLEPLIAVKSYKLRVGDYRVIMDVDWKDKILFVLLIDHRKRIYKTLK